MITAVIFLFNFVFISRLLSLVPQHPARSMYSLMLQPKTLSWRMRSSLSYRKPSQRWILCSGPSSSSQIMYPNLTPEVAGPPQVSFFLTAVLGRRRRSISTPLDDYKEMALASGGQAIQVSKNQLPQATDIILDTSTSALVRLCNLE